MNTMPFPGGSQEVPRSLLVALPEFRVNPLNGRAAPNTGISRSIAPSQKRTFGASWFGHFRALSRSRIQRREASCSGCGELKCRKS